MAQLFDASPLMQNDLNSTENKGYDTERAKSAAKSAYEVIRYMDGSKSALIPMVWLVRRIYECFLF